MNTPTKLHSPTSTAGSWLALVAQTTLGPDAVTVRAKIRGRGFLPTQTYRLVVQSYDTSDGRFLSRRTRPVASVQRAVTGDELRHGVTVSLVELWKERPLPDKDPALVAWVEVGSPDLEFDGLNARPARGSVVGVARRDACQETVQIRLDRRRAA
jgi:hypothetical protein